MSPCPVAPTIRMVFWGSTSRSDTPIDAPRCQCCPPSSLRMTVPVRLSKPYTVTPNTDSA